MLAEWILGDDAEGNHYLIHTRTPEFIGRLARDNDDASIKGITMELDSGEVLCDIRWYDTPPSNLLGLHARINAALDAHDDAAMEELDNH